MDLSGTFLFLLWLPCLIACVYGLGMLLFGYKKWVKITGALLFVLAAFFFLWFFAQFIG